jgi:hypothetical protein
MTTLRKDKPMKLEKIRLARVKARQRLRAYGIDPNKVDDEAFDALVKYMVKYDSEEAKP